MIARQVENFIFHFSAAFILPILLIDALLLAGHLFCTSTISNMQYGSCETCK